MKSLFIVLFALCALNANAIELKAYKSTSSSIVTLADSEVNKIFSDSYGSPACLKDGSKIVGVNKAFTAKRLGYRDCSTSDAAKAKQHGLGYEVVVVKFEQLSPALMKQVTGNK
jgi:hypothetical protein